jgi:hypothetical protein
MIDPPGQIGNSKKLDKLFMMHLYNPEIYAYAARSAVLDEI